VSETRFAEEVVRGWSKGRSSYNSRGSVSRESVKEEALYSMKRAK